MVGFRCTVHVRAQVRQGEAPERTFNVTGPTVVQVVAEAITRALEPCLDHWYGETIIDKKLGTIKLEVRTWDF